MIDNKFWGSYFLFFAVILLGSAGLGTMGLWNLPLQGILAGVVVGTLSIASSIAYFKGAINS